MLLLASLEESLAGTPTKAYHGHQQQHEDLSKVVGDNSNDGGNIYVTSFCITMKLWLCHSLVRSELYAATKLLNCYCTYCFVVSFVL